MVGDSSSTYVDDQHSALGFELSIFARPFSWLFPEMSTTAKKVTVEEWICKHRRIAEF